MSKYPDDIECPKCNADNKGGAKNIEEFCPDEYHCHACGHMWEDPLAMDE